MTARARRCSAACCSPGSSPRSRTSACGERRCVKTFADMDVIGYESTDLDGVMAEDEEMAEQMDLARRQIDQAVAVGEVRRQADGRARSGPSGWKTCPVPTRCRARTPAVRAVGAPATPGRLASVALVVTVALAVIVAGCTDVPLPAPGRARASHGNRPHHRPREATPTTTTTTTTTTEPPLPVTPVQWTPCGDLQCGSVTVPLDYARPGRPHPPDRRGPAPGRGSPRSGSGHWSSTRVVRAPRESTTCPTSCRC